MTFSYPGVYIREFDPGAPIQGVGTSTAAFIGPCMNGRPNEAVKITNWEQFKKQFGSVPVSNHYLWYAVYGFFRNGGTVCYVFRVSNAEYASLTFVDSAGNPTIVLQARELGIPSTPILASVQASSTPLVNTRLYRLTAALTVPTDNTIRVASANDAPKFRPGDKVTWTGASAGTDYTVERVQGQNIFLNSTPSPLPGTGTTLRLVNPKVGDTVLRVESSGSKLSPGAVISLEQNAIPPLNLVVKSVLPEKISLTETTYRVELRLPIPSSNINFANIVRVVSHEFDITVQSAQSTTYENLSMDTEHPNYYARVIRNDPDGLVLAQPAVLPNPNVPISPTALTALGGGIADNPATLTSNDYKNALASLEAVDDINLICIPDRNTPGDDVQTAMQDHCERMHDRFAILDCARGAPPFGADSVTTHRNSLTTDNGFGALYYPWLLVTDYSGKEKVLVPPSGHVAGIMARIDENRGVHKAPAGEEAIVRECLGLDTVLSNEDQGQLNLSGINVIRVFVPGGRPVIWGARTTASNTSWQYVNIRRLFLFLEESIQDGIRWAVFEPNNEQLWKKIKRTITAFLSRVRRDGALFGETDDQAFYVRIDDVLNPFDEQALGRLNIEIGIRPSYPAEFIIIRIGIWPGGSSVNES